MYPNESNENKRFVRCANRHTNHTCAFPHKRLTIQNTPSRRHTETCFGAAGGGGGGETPCPKMMKSSFLKSQILTFGRQKKFGRKRPYLRNRWADIASRPLKSKLLAWATWKPRQVVSNLPWEHRRARGAQKRGQKMTFLVFFAPKMVQNSDFTIFHSHPELDGRFAEWLETSQKWWKKLTKQKIEPTALLLI